MQPLITRTQIVPWFVALTAAFPLVAVAEPSSQDPFSFARPKLPTGGLVGDCFKYYRFGSVSVDLLPASSQAASGTSLQFRGHIVNHNTYPLVDARVYVKVFRDRPEGSGDHGDDVVDQFVAAEGLALPADGAVPLQFDWQVPSYASSGSYRLATFVIVGGRYNLLGLSFTDDVVGNTVPFEVAGEVETSVVFDKSTVTVGSQPYHFAAPPLRIAADKPVTVTASLTNTSSSAETATIVWDLYRWDAQHDRNRILPALPSRSVIVPARSSVPISITIPPGTDPVVLAEGTAHWRNTRSILNVRVVRDGLDQPRLNFPSLTAFPLRRGEPVSLFSCLHNAGASPLVDDVRVELDVHDIDGTLIHTTNYAGPVSSAMMGIAESFTPAHSHGSVLMRARLYHHGRLADETTFTYRCTDLDPSSCPNENDGEVASSPSERLNSPAILGALGFGLVVVLAVIWWWRRRRRTITSETVA